MLERIRDTIDHLEWIILLILVIVADGLVGGLYRAAGKETVSKVIGWVMVISYLASIASFLQLRGIPGFAARVVTLVCFILDLVTVIRDKRIIYFAA